MREVLALALSKLGRSCSAFVVTDAVDAGGEALVDQRQPRFQANDERQASYSGLVNLAGTPASDDFTPIGSVLLSVPTQSQLPDLPNGCEVTSLSMLLTAGGTPVDKDVLAREQPSSLTPPVFSGPAGDFYSISRWGNPNRAFVGNVEGYGYGIYHAPLAKLLNKKTHGLALDLMGRPFSEILDRLRLGMPVVVWTTSTFAPTTRWVTWTTPEGPVRATQLEHAVLLVGYTRDKLVVNNPLTGRQEQISPAPS